MLASVLMTILEINKSSLKNQHKLEITDRCLLVARQKYSDLLILEDSLARFPPLMFQEVSMISEMDP